MHVVRRQPSGLSYQFMSRISFRRILGLAIASVLAIVFLVSAQSFAASPYAPNVTAVTSTTVTVTSGSVSVNAATIGMNVSVSGLTGITGSLNITTETLNSPSSGVVTISSPNNVFYYDVHIALPAGASTPSACSAAISISNSFVTSTDTLDYWTGSAWAQASGVSISGNTITGSIPCSALTGTNVAIVPAGATTTSTSTSSSLTSTDAALLAVGVVVIVLLIGAGILMRGRGKAKPAPTA